MIDDALRTTGGHFSNKNMSISSWRGDVAGGSAAALAALPIELVYGLLAVAPLGTAYADHGLRAALWGCVLGGVLGFVLRTSGGMITGSRPATGLILGTLATTLLQHPKLLAAPDPAALAFVLLLICTALAGLCQCLFGLGRLGRVLKYVPYPVVSGLMGGVGLLMLLSALRPGLGVAGGMPWGAVPQAWHPLSLVVTVATLAICVRAPRWTRRLPGAVLALVGGTVLHHGLASAFGAEHLGPTSGSAHGLFPQLSVWQAVLAGGGWELLGWLRLLLPYALAIAAFASLESLLCLAAIEADQHRRLDGDRELSRQGLANGIAGLLGATPSVGNLSRVKVNLSGGGTTPRSSLAYGLTLAAVVLFAGRWASWVPGAATAGILIYYAATMVDDGALRLARQVFLERRGLPPGQYRLLLANFLVIILVALVATAGDMMEALTAGVIAAMVLFVRSSMKPVIRQTYSAQCHRSLKVRASADTERLARTGDQIVVFELDGPLFFGTADRAAREIEKAARHAAWLIVDLTRVSDVDPTGARSLYRIGRQLADQRRQLFVCGASLPIEQFLRAMGLGATVPARHWHPDIDTALEAAEDALLGAEGDAYAGVSLAQSMLADGLTAAQARLLEDYLEQRIVPAAAPIFRVGEPGDSLFVASDGVVDILLPLKQGRRRRIASFAPGNIFGELALLEAKPRSADAVAQGACTIWELKRARLAEIEAQHPELASRLLLNLSRSLAHRVRTTTAEFRLAMEAL